MRYKDFLLLELQRLTKRYKKSNNMIQKKLLRNKIYMYVNDLREFRNEENCNFDNRCSNDL